MIYQDASKPVAERVTDLLSRMTLAEKVSQLTSVWAYEIIRNGQINEDKCMAKMGQGLGQITRLGGASSFKPDEAARAANQIQRFLVEKTRLGIPAIIHEESCAGYLTRGANVFPQALGIGASFEPELAQEMGAIIREQMMALGARQALAPLLDITRDPRWGRTEETYGEDRYLTARMGVSYIRGLQSDSLEQGILATGKHFVGYGQSEGGMNWAPAHISRRDLLENFLFPFEAAVKEANLRSIMPGYHELDGVPCHTNQWLLEDLLRQEWGFDGLVVSDYFGINMIFDYHKAAPSKDHAARMALAAGVDIELPSTDVYSTPLIQAVENGLVDASLLDKIVSRVLAMKFRLGLFENPYVAENDVESHFQSALQRAFSRKAAEKSIVLLKNDGTLPLAPGKKKIAVIGPNADSIRNMLGDYSYPAHVESLLDMAEDNFANTELPEDRLSVADAMPPMQSILAGLKAVGGSDISWLYAKGCDVLPEIDKKTGEMRLSDFAEAIQIASQADLSILVLGDKAGLIENCTSGEARDRTSLDLPGQQKELLQAVCAVGKPVVLVLVNGRPYSLSWEDQHVNAIVEAWLPGEEGAAAIADVLFGQVNPGGKLPISFPRTVGQVPVFYAHRPSGGRSHWKGDYVDESSKPLYAFGHGLSYTTFEYSDLVLPAQVAIDGSLELSFSLQNTGSIAGEEVVQLYLHDCSADITRPVQQLYGFKRLMLQPGEKCQVQFTVSTDQMGFYDRDMNVVVEPGEMELMIGSASNDVRLQGLFELSGDKRVVVNKKFASQVKIFKA
ncbi:MAG: glycoside hydrolase family 3 N-terminal domain-containing protein [Eubacteriales bacterium]|nr:glycoside hydrolase family 3 N-terminal domain-containing protein [Eubacteriales bacterium]